MDKKQNCEDYERKSQEGDNRLQIKTAWELWLEEQKDLNSLKV